MLRAKNAAETPAAIRYNMAPLAASRTYLRRKIRPRSARRGKTLATGKRHVPRRGSITRKGSMTYDDDDDDDDAATPRSYVSRTKVDLLRGLFLVPLYLLLPSLPRLRLNLKPLEKPRSGHGYHARMTFFFSFTGKRGPATTNLARFFLLLPSRLSALHPPPPGDRCPP